MTDRAEVRSKKSEYLHLMLESQGYSLKDFLLYLGTLKQDGGNVDEWSLSEFPGLVSQYRQVELERKLARVNCAAAKEWKYAFVFAPDTLEESVRTKTPEKLKIYESNVCVKVKDVRKKDIGKILYNVHTYYVLETQPQGWRVERRYKDMLKLRRCLCNFFPGYIIPALPSVLFDGENEEQVCSEYIELFFEHLVKIPEIRGFEPLEKFLELSDRKDFLKYLNALFKLPKKENLQEMFHQSGTAPTGITADLITFTKNATAFARQDRESLDEYFTFIMNIDRLYKLNRNMAQQFEQMTNELRKASLIFRKLSSNAMTIQKRKLKFIYKNIEAMLMNWSSLMESQWRHFREDFSNYFKYYLFEGEAILDLAKNTQVAEEKYLEKENELALLKHKLFQSKDLDKWKMQPEDRKIFEQTTLMHNKKLSFPKMLPDETKVVEEHFTRYGYYLNRMKAEVDRVVDTRVEEMFNHFAVVANNYAKSAKEMANVWMDFEEKIEPLEEGENVPKRMELHVHLNVEDETETEAEEIIKSLKGSVVEKNKELVVENKLNATVPVIIQENSREEEDKSSEGGEEDALMVGSKGLKKINSYPTEIMKKDLLGKRRGEISQYAIYEKVLRKDEKDMREVDEKRQLMEENGTP